MGAISGRLVKECDFKIGIIMIKNKEVGTKLFKKEEIDYENDQSPLLNLYKNKIPSFIIVITTNLKERRYLMCTQYNMNQAFLPLELSDYRVPDHIVFQVNTFVE